LDQQRSIATRRIDGIDDNYIVDQTKTTDEDDEDDEEDGNARLPLVAVLEHASSQRRLTVRSNTPGVQVYTANYVNGNVLDATKCKDAATYGPWQGICLETQHYPDSIITSNKEELLTFAEFAKGKCVILCGKDDKYHHTMEYEFGNST
jgi:galactose mutarotase-like enzyme